MTQTQSETVDTDADSHRATMKAFVHEVLRRSRTSTGVLQTALCYLEAVKVKVPDLQMQMQENQSESVQQKMVPPVAVSIEWDEEDGCGAKSVDGIILENLNASRSGEDVVEVEDACSRAHACTLSPPSSLPSLPSQRTLPSFKLTPIAQSTETAAITAPPDLPNPLLCPRRTFLASLILASKFTQDRTYSNRAWARLAGFEPREVGRCERALGEALEWRLWVGRKVVAEKEKDNQKGMAVGRTRSDGDLRGPIGSGMGHDTGLKASGPALVRAPARVGNLQRSATVPNLDSNPDPNFNFDPTVNFNYNASANANASANVNTSGGMTWWREFDSGSYGPPETEIRTPANTNTNPYTYTFYGSPCASSTCSSITPTLSSSPASSTSSASSGERTALMGSFLEVPGASTLGDPGAGCACGFEGSGYACRYGCEGVGYGREYRTGYGNASVGCGAAPPALPRCTIVDVRADVRCARGDVGADADADGWTCAVFARGVGGAE